MSKMRSDWKKDFLSTNDTIVIITTQSGEQEPQLVRKQQLLVATEPPKSSDSRPWMLNRGC